MYIEKLYTDLPNEIVLKHRNKAKTYNIQFKKFHIQNTISKETLLENVKVLRGDCYSYLNKLFK